MKKLLLLAGLVGILLVLLSTRAGCGIGTGGAIGLGDETYQWEVRIQGGKVVPEMSIIIPERG